MHDSEFQYFQVQLYKLQSTKTIWNIFQYYSKYENLKKSYVDKHRIMNCFGNTNNLLPFGLSNAYHVVKVQAQHSHCPWGFRWSWICSAILRFRINPFESWTAVRPTTRISLPDWCFLWSANAPTWCPLAIDPYSFASGSIRQVWDSIVLEVSLFLFKMFRDDMLKHVHLRMPYQWTITAEILICTIFREKKKMIWI